MRKLKVAELSRISIDEFKQTDKTPLIVVLDNVRSLNNIGSVFRTSDAFASTKYISAASRLLLRIPTFTKRLWGQNIRWNGSTFRIQ